MPKNHWLDVISESFEGGVYTFQAPADSHTARVIHVWLLAHRAIRFLEAHGYSEAAQLKADFGFWVTPKTLAKKVGQAVSLLSKARNQVLSIPFYEENSEVPYLSGLIKKLESVL